MIYWSANWTGLELNKRSHYLLPKTQKQRNDIAFIVRKDVSGTVYDIMQWLQINGWIISVRLHG